MNYKELRLGIIHKLLGLCDLRFADPSSSLIILRVGVIFFFFLKNPCLNQEVSRWYCPVIT